jgi:hypothetical protein
MANSDNPFRWFDSSPEVIQMVVMLYVRFPLSLRNVEDLAFERGIDICHETVRKWVSRFGPMFASKIRARRVAVCGNTRTGSGISMRSTSASRATGPRTSLWNRVGRCKRIGCNGQVEFQAKAPGMTAHEHLWTYDEPEAPGWAERRLKAAEALRQDAERRNTTPAPLRPRRNGLSLELHHPQWSARERCAPHFEHTGYLVRANCRRCIA